MAEVRIRWRGVAKVAAIALVGLLAARLLPTFLRAPEPPPLSADVGLPKAAPVTDVPRPARHPRKRRQRPHRRRSLEDRPSGKPRSRTARDAPASKAVIGSKRRHRVAVKPPHDSQKVARSTPPPAPRYVPPAVPEAIPEPPPEPSAPLPSTPGDGSQEFAPH